MNFGWETQEERLLRFMKISPKEKLEWLHEASKFIAKLPFTRDRYIDEKQKRNEGGNFHLT